MQTLTRQQPSKKTSPNMKPQRRRRFSPLMLIGGLVTLVIILGLGAFYVIQPHLGSHAAAINGDCSLIVPAHPLTAQGLATPYQLLATNPANGPCHEATATQAAFVQGAILDPATGKISVYNPLVVDRGTKPAIAPVVPNLPQDAIVALWFGSNGNTLTLQSSHSSTQEGRCVNGADRTIFGQFAYCNAPAFFDSANRAIQEGKLVPPALGKGKDGLVCPTVRDFSVIDMDQSDNVTTTYLITHNGQTAQMTATNTAKLQNSILQTNGSDNRLLDVALDGALGCTPWMEPDLADPGHTVSALPLNELQAAAHQAAPMALVPNHDPMVTVNNDTNLDKLNAYRAGVDQPVIQDTNLSNTKTYCMNYVNIAPQRILFDSLLTKKQASPDAGAANTLFTFLAQRFNATWGPDGLNCQGLLKQNSPIVVTNDADDVAIDAVINGTDVASTATSCSFNGTVVKNCTGTTNVNGQVCTLAFDKNTNQVNITCNPQQKK